MSSYRTLLGVARSSLLQSSLLGAALLFASSPAFGQASNAPTCDPSANVVYAPAKGEHGLVLFEDLWPSKGDIDFNDASLAYNYAIEMNSAGQVTTVHATFNLLSAGATIHNDVKLRLPGVPAGAAGEITRTALDGTTAQVAPLAAESDLVVPIFPQDTLRLFGDAFVNTIASKPTVAPIAYNLTIRFAAPVALDASTAPFDVYLERTGEPGHQIHRPEYAGTASMNTALFGTADDGTSATRHFVDTDGLPFALNIPQIVDYPQETIAIDRVYPDLIAFALSGGVNHTDWYLTNEVKALAFTGGANGSGVPAPVFVGPVSPCGSMDKCKAVTCPAQDACHSAGTCDPSTGACSNPSKPDGTACNDGNLCAEGETCHSGTCTGAPLVCGERVAYLAERVSGSVDRIDLTTGAITTLSHDLGELTGLVVDGKGRLFVAQTTGGNILQLDRQSGTASVIAAGLVNASMMAADPANGTLYVVADFDALNNPNSGTLSKIVETTPGVWTTATLKSGLGSPIGVTLTGHHLYVTERSNGNIGDFNLDLGTYGTVVTLPVVNGGAGDGLTQVGGGDLIVASYFDGLLYRVALSPARIVRSYTGFSNPTSVLFDSTDNTVLVSQRNTPTLVRLNLDTDARTPVATPGYAYQAAFVTNQADACNALGACDPASGMCGKTATANGTACSDGDPNTAADSCLGGVCSGTQPLALYCFDLADPKSDCSTNGRDLSREGDANGAGATRVANGTGGAASFDGATGYFDRYDAAFTPGSQDWSSSLWFKPAPGSPSTLLSWYRCGANPGCSPGDGADYSLSWIPASPPGSLDQVQDFTRDDSLDLGTINLTASHGPSGFSDGCWHLLTQVQSPLTQTRSFYVDGVLAATATVTPPSPAPSFSDYTPAGTPLTLGASFIQSYRPRGGYSYYSGLMDDVRIYNLGLTANEVSNQYTSSVHAGCGP